MTVTWIGALEVVACSGFAAALAVVVYALFSRLRRIGSVPAILIVASLLLLFAVSVSNVLEYNGVTAALDPLEDHLEIAVLPLLVYAMYAWYSEDQLARSRSSRRAALSEHHLLMTILDSSPVGMALVDSDGRATYANAYAREVLELRDDEGHSHAESRGRVVDSDANHQPRHLFASIAGQEFRNRHMLYRSPTGSTAIGVSAVPFHEGVAGTSLMVFHLLDSETDGVAH